MAQLTVTPDGPSSWRVEVADDDDHTTSHLVSVPAKHFPEYREEIGAALSSLALPICKRFSQQGSADLGNHQLQLDVVRVAKHKH